MNSRSTPLPVGATFGLLTIIQEAPPKFASSGKKVRYALCECSCINKTRVTTQVASLKNGHTSSCGCYKKVATSERFTKHGLYKNPLYKVWDGMMQRCYNKNSEHYSRYGKKGITICNRWKQKKDFQGLKRFIKWSEIHGYRKGLEIDRKNNNDRYSPENCRWVTKKVNMNNRSVTVIIKHKNKKYSFDEFFNKYRKNGVTKRMAYERIKRHKWKPLDAVTLPRRKYPNADL